MPVDHRLDGIDVESGAPRDFAEPQVGSPDASDRKSREARKLGGIKNIEEGDNIPKEQVVPGGSQGIADGGPSAESVVYLARERSNGVYLGHCRISKRCTLLS